jgi:RNase P/RNase MRP subunit POP5
MKQRRRYVVFKTVGGGREEIMHVVECLKREFKEGPPIKLVECNQEAGLGLLRCGHLQLLRLKAKIPEIGGEVKISVVGVSGTIKKARKKFM